MKITRSIWTICILVVLLTCALAPTAFATTWTATAPSGYTADGDFEISSAGELAWIAAQVNNGYDTFEGQTITLTENIDLNSQEWTPIGIYGSSTYFKGTFDGGGHTISGLYINQTNLSSTYYAGLFGYMTYGGTLIDVSVSGTVTATGTGSVTIYAGGLVGQIDSSCTAMNCVADVEVIVDGYKNYAGGLVGYSGNSDVYNCYATGDVTVTGSYGTYAGGVVGYSSTGSDVSNCYATGAVSASGGSSSNYKGGVVGYNNSWNDSNLATVTNCYFKSS